MACFQKIKRKFSNIGSLLYIYIYINIYIYSLFGSEGSFIYLEYGDFIKEKQINSLLCLFSVQRFDVGSYSEASTVDPVALTDIFSQPHKSHLPKPCFAEGKNILFITVTTNEQRYLFGNFQTDRYCLPETLICTHKNSNKCT